jgi:hypothetical protein
MMMKPILKRTLLHQSSTLSVTRAMNSKCSGTVPRNMEFLKQSN